MIQKTFYSRLMSTTAMVFYGAAFASLLGGASPAAAGDAGIRTNPNYVEIYSGQTATQNLGIYFDQITAYANQNNTRYYHNCYTFSGDPNSNYCYIYTVMPDHESTPHITEISSLNDCTAGDRSCWDNINYFQTQDCFHPESQSRYVCAVYNDRGYRDCDGDSAILFTGLVVPTRPINIPSSYGHVSRKVCLSSGADLSGLADDHIINDGVLDLTTVTQAVTFGNLSGTGELLINTHDLTIAGTSLGPFEFSGVISGDGTLTIEAGRQILSGTNDYTGGTTVNSGATLQLGTGGTTGSVMGPILDDGTLVFNRSDSFTVASQITGAGNVQIAGPGQLNLSGAMGANDASIGTITNQSRLRVLAGGAIWASGITNAAGAQLIVDQGGAIHDALNNSGVVSNSGTYTADVNNTGAGAVITNTATGVWNGNILTNSGGAVIHSLGVWNGTTNNAATGTVNAQGTLNGAVANAGAFNLTGGLAAGGNGFSNASTGILTVGGNAYSGLAAVTNAAGGQIRIGTSAVNGSLAAFSMSNSGALSLQNGRTGDAVALTGAYTGVAGSTIALDANLNNNGNLADRITAATASGTSAISIQNSSPGKIFFTNPIVLVAAGGGTGTFTAASDSQTAAALASNGIVDYRFGKLGATGNWGITASVNTTGAASIAADTSTVLSTLNSSFYLNAHELVGESSSHDKWSTQMWGRAERGNNRLKLITTSSDANSASNASRTTMEFNGAQMGGSLRLTGDRLKVHFGIMGGWTESTVSTRGDIHSDVKIPFYGFYSVASAPGVLLDFQAHHDDLKIRPDALLTTASLKGTSDTVSVALALPHTFGVYTVELYGSYTYSRVAIDPVALNGSVGSLAFSRLSGAIGRVGMRLTSVTTRGDTVLRPYLSIGAAQEFGDKAITTFQPLGGAGDVVMQTDRVGSFAQVSSGVTAQWKNGTEAYIQAGARLGKSIRGVSASMGIRLRF